MQKDRNICSCKMKKRNFICVPIRKKSMMRGKFKILLSNADAGIGRILGAGLKVNYQDSGDVCINQCKATEAEIQTFVEALRAYEGIPIPDDGMFGSRKCACRIWKPEKAPAVLREALPPHILIITADFYNKEYTR